MRRTSDGPCAVCSHGVMLCTSRAVVRLLKSHFESSAALFSSNKHTITQHRTTDSDIDTVAIVFYHVLTSWLRSKKQTGSDIDSISIVSIIMFGTYLCRRLRLLTL